MQFSSARYICLVGQPIFRTLFKPETLSPLKTPYLPFLQVLEATILLSVSMILIIPATLYK